MTQREALAALTLCGPHFLHPDLGADIGASYGLLSSIEFASTDAGPMVWADGTHTGQGVSSIKLAEAIAEKIGVAPEWRSDPAARHAAACAAIGAWLAASERAVGAAS
jgi:hypothetical protein